MILAIYDLSHCPIVPSAVNTAEVSDFAGYLGTKFSASRGSSCLLRCQNLKGIKEPFRTMTVGGVDYICITDIARQKNAADPNGVVGNWLRNRNTIEYLGLW